MRSFRHWTPRYVFDRVAWEVWQRRHPEAPWLTREAVRVLSTLLRPKDVGLEWGSGRSTLWFAKRIQRLVSVEDNEQWYRSVSEKIGQQGLKNVDYRFRPNVGEDDSQDSDYVTTAAEFADASVDFVLVDGKSRGACALQAARVVRTGGLLVVDNVNWYLPFATRSPASFRGEGGRTELWRRFAGLVADWRVIYMSQGVTDTAIWIRPGGMG